MTELTLLVNSVLLAVLGGMSRQLYRINSDFKFPADNLLKDHKVKEEDLPSVSVCIPARNEGHALADSLQLLLMSDYPKLEIIVLDDNSSDNTTALIKSFASEGVRFVEGSPLKAGWLGKNHALKELLDEASGSLVLFIDIDTHVESGTITKLVNYTLANDVDMVSVLPRRVDPTRASVVMSPLRFFWEVMFHRADAPASANNAWLVKRSTLTAGEFEGFASLSSVVKPEARIAARLAEQNKYRFVVGTKNLGLNHQKKWRSQLDTSIRLLYPMLGGKWWLAIFAVLDLLIMLIPPTLVAVSLTSSVTLPAIIFWPSLVVAASYSILYGIYTKRVWQHGWLIGAILWPVLVLQEAVLVAVSAVKYARGTVTWKGRPVLLEEQN